MSSVVNAVDSGINLGALSSAVPSNAGAILITLTIFGIGIYFARKIMSGASKGKAKI